MNLNEASSELMQKMEQINKKLADLERRAANPILQLTRVRGSSFSQNFPSPSTYHIPEHEQLKVNLAKGEVHIIDLASVSNQDIHSVPAPSDREGYGGQNHRLYWESGLIDFIKVQNVAGKLLGGNALKLLDFGCSSGRFARHPTLIEPSWQIFACDIDAMHIKWVKTFLPPKIVAFQNTIYPHLPLPDSSLDMVTAFSVFTHIDQLEDAWLLEIRRILRPGGILYASAHTERVWSRIADRPATLKFMLTCRPQWSVPEGMELSEALFRSEMPGDHLILRFRDGGAYVAHTFHSQTFIKDNWGRLFDVLEIYDAYHTDFQDVVVLQKPK
jgi:SAM-dependent methyltransferase